MLSAELLGTIFAPHSPLHDGAVIIVGDTIKAAGAILPLTQNPVRDRDAGHAPPGGHRPERGDRRDRDRGQRGDFSRISVAYRGRIESGRGPASALREMLESIAAPLSALPVRLATPPRRSPA